jgi:hypothetical protein
MTFIFLLASLLILFSFICLCNDLYGWAYASIAIGSYLISVPIWEYGKDGPSAIEVYQGKTTLLKTYKDSVVIDSVVVYKDKK